MNILNIKHYRLHLLFLVFALFTLACESSNESTPDNTTNYADPYNWAHIAESPVYDADIFYIHPTTYYDDSDTAKANWEISNNGQPAEYVNGALFSQASIFFGIANIYAPYYRQMNINIAFDENNDYEFNIAYQDLKKSFLYYFEHYNNGRPFFILGHSQGANLGLELIKDIFDDKKYSDKLIAAYIVGWPVVQEELDAYPHLKVLTTPEGTGGVIPWDVVAEDTQWVLPTVAPNSIMVNPLTWTDSREPIPAENNLGAVFFNTVDGEYTQVCNIPGFTGGQIKEMPAIDGVIQNSYTSIATPNILNDLVNAGADVDKDSKYGCYHVIAINLFYENIRENAAIRKSVWFENN